jgi:AraC family transcriptional regulator
MDPQIKKTDEKKLIGMSMKMAVINNRTFELWKNFMPRRKEIKNAVSKDLFSLQVYPKGFNFGRFDPQMEFTKWAAAEVPDFEEIPPGLDTFILESGLYAVFDYKGLSTDTKIFKYIFFEWLPKSNYLLDHRPHFEVLGGKYKNNDPDSEEEIWIPVKSA